MKIKRLAALFMCVLTLCSLTINVLAEAGIPIPVDNVQVVCNECGAEVDHNEECSLYTPIAPAENTEATETAEATDGSQMAGCAECGQAEGHSNTCSRYVIPASAACSVCGQTDGHLVGCLATFTEVNKSASFIKYPVTLYCDPAAAPESGRVFDAGDFGSDFVFTVQYALPGEDGITWYMLDTENWGIFEGTDKPYSYIQSTYVTFDLNSEGKTEQTLTDESAGVQVSGNFPEGTSLSVESATLNDVAEIDPSLAGIPEKHKVMDISLVKDDVEYQPDESVTVTMDVSDVKSSGEDIFIYHVHENEDGTVTPEILGPFRVDENGDITFDMNSFSYVLVFSGKAEYTLENVEVFYPVLEAPSGNGHYQFLGIYYDTNNDLHFLLATCDKTPTAAEDKFVSFYIDEVQYIVSDMKENVEKIEVQTYSKVEFKDAETNAVMDTVNITENKGIAKGFYDVNVGKQAVGQNFGFAVSQDSNMPSGSQAWNINGMVKVDLDYELIKTVAAGTSATGVTFGESVNVERGDWVIFKIEVKNNGDRPLTDMLVQDILPEGVFDMSSVQMSIDGENGEIGNWQPFNQTLFDDYNSEGHFSRQLYIKAQVNPELAITTDTTYTNKATIDGMNMPTYEDTASVVVKAPTTGTLTVSKAVTSENPNDPAPVMEFAFTIHSDAANAGPFKYKKSDETTGSVENGGTFTLKNGESIEFDDFPVGTFTVTETDTAGFATKVNGTAGTVYEGEMKALAAPVVAFENRFSTRMATLHITKQVEKEYENDVLPDHTFNFTVVIGDDTETETEYPYTIGETSGTIKSGGTIQLKAGQTAVIENIPVGTAYTVTEVLGDLSDDYKTAVNDTENSNTASGKMELGINAVVVVNTYKQHFTDLTITKAGWNPIDENQSFIFDVVEPNGFKITVTINGNGSVTIKNVPFGEYTVTERTDWSWRYDPDGNDQKITLNSNPDLNTVAFVNTRTEGKWLSGDSYAKNIFNGVDSVKSSFPNALPPKRDGED